MPHTPQPRAVPHLWRWAELLPLAARSAELVPVGRGGERRAIALANPGLRGDAYATPTLWAAIQYLGPREDAPAHRHTQTAFRFVVEGEGVWTNVDGDPVPCAAATCCSRRAGTCTSTTTPPTTPMAWIDGLDIPLGRTTDAGFFEFGPDELADRRDTPERSRSERLWGHPGLRPVGAPAHARLAADGLPLGAHRRRATAQLELEAEGHPGVVEPGHAAVRYTNPATGGDALPTIRAEMHRLARRHRRPRRRRDGRVVGLAGVRRRRHGRPSATSSCEVATRRPVRRPVLGSRRRRPTARDPTGLDLFRFSDAPVFEALGLARASPRRPRR